jgi:hypothetical protein
MTILDPSERKTIKKTSYTIQTVTNRLKEGNTMQAMALSYYLAIHQKINVSKFTEQDIYLLKDTSKKSERKKHYLLTERGVHHENIAKEMWGIDYPLINDLFLGNIFSLMDRFFEYKVSLFLEPLYDMQKTFKESLINEIKQIFHRNHITDIEPRLESKFTLYKEYIFFILKEIVSFGLEHDSDFNLLKHQFKENTFTQQVKPSPILFNTITDMINADIKSYHLDLQTNQSTWTSGCDFSNPIFNVAYNYVQGDVCLEEELLKKELNSHEKGQLGENLYSQIFGGEVVGFAGNKTDVITFNNEKVSIKSSYTQNWNNHLSYLNKKNASHQHIIDALNEEKSLSKIKNIQWADTFEGMFIGQDKLNSIVFQQVKMDKLNRHVEEGHIWKIDIGFLKNIFQQKQFIFQNNNIIFFHDDEQFLKISFKKRTDKVQIMVLTDEMSLNRLAESNLAQYHKFEKQNLKKKNLSM